MKEVVAVPVSKSGWRSTLVMKGMLVLTPRDRVSLSARTSLSHAPLKLSDEAVTCERTPGRCEWEMWIAGVNGMRFVNGVRP